MLSILLHWSIRFDQHYVIYHTNTTISHKYYKFLMFSFPRSLTSLVQRVSMEVVNDGGVVRSIQNNGIWDPPHRKTWKRRTAYCAWTRTTPENVLGGRYNWLIVTHTIQTFPLYTSWNLWMFYLHTSTKVSFPMFTLVVMGTFGCGKRYFAVVFPGVRKSEIARVRCMKKEPTAPPSLSSICVQGCIIERKREGLSSAASSVKRYFTGTLSSTMFPCFKMIIGGNRSKHAWIQLEEI
jgi:hypothetical protein